MTDLVTDSRARITMENVPPHGQHTSRRVSAVHSLVARHNTLVQQHRSSPIRHLDQHSEREKIRGRLEPNRAKQTGEPAARYPLGHVNVNTCAATAVSKRVAKVEAQVQVGTRHKRPPRGGRSNGQATALRPHTPVAQRIARAERQSFTADTTDAATTADAGGDKDCQDEETGQRPHTPVAARIAKLLAASTHRAHRAQGTQGSVQADLSSQGPAAHRVGTDRLAITRQSTLKARLAARRAQHAKAADSAGGTDSAPSPEQIPTVATDLKEKLRMKRSNTNRISTSAPPAVVQHVENHTTPVRSFVSNCVSNCELAVAQEMSQVGRARTSPDRTNEPVPHSKTPQTVRWQPPFAAVAPTMWAVLLRGEPACL